MPYLASQIVLAIFLRATELSVGLPVIHKSHKIPPPFSSWRLAEPVSHLDYGERSAGHISDSAIYQARMHSLPRMRKSIPAKIRHSRPPAHSPDL